MASMIKSGKILRHLTGLARNLVFNSHRNTDGNLNRLSRLSCTAFTKGFASAVQRPDQNVDQSIKKLDEEVRRAGRISRLDVEEVFDLIRRKKTATSTQSLLLIRCCGNSVPEELPEARTALVQDIWKTLNTIGVQMDISHYNALLRVYLDNGHQFVPTEFLAELESKGIEPNRVTFQRLISRYCQEGDIDGATKILEIMRAKNIPINADVFNSLITGHSEAGDIEAAIGILPVMTQAKLEPTPETYTNLLCAFAKHGRTGEILSTLDECESKQIYLADKNLFEIIFNLAANGHSDFVDNILSRVQKSYGYNQLAASLILGLVNKGHEDVAFKILKSMVRGTKPSGELFDIGTFFLRQLVKSKCPAEKILAFCQELQQTGLHNRATLAAAELAAKSGSVDIAVSIFNELKQNELPVRHHFFWPLICAAGKNGNDAVLDVLRVMQTEFDISVNGETLRDYVLPNLQERDYEKLILTLRTAGVSSSNAILSCVHHALIHKRMKAAADLMSTYAIYYQPGVLRRPLVDALMKTNDFENYQRIVRIVYESVPRLQKIQSAGAVDEELGGDSQLQSEVIGQIVMDVVVNFGENRASVTEKILSGLVEQGLSVSKFQAERIQSRLGESLTPEISALLDKLTAGDLEPVAYETRTRVKFDFADMPAFSLENMIKQKEAKGENVNGLLRSLLRAHYIANDVQKYEELVDKLSTTDFVLSSGVYSQLISLHCSHNNLDKALAVHAEIKSREPDFLLGDFYSVKLVESFVANGRIDEAVEFLKSNKRAEKSKDERSPNYDHTCWKILNLLAEKGNDADVTRVFNALEENNFVEANNGLLGALIKVHLVNDDITKAMEAFEQICTKYRCTPLKNEVSRKLIEMEDATRLQLVTDFATTIHGEVNCLYDLILCFVECGRIRQARKILETPGLPSRPRRITDACVRYRRDGKTALLESLVQATRDVTKVDRHEIFYNLLLCYIDEDATEKALDLWTNIQEEDVAPSDKFLTTLANYLNGKGVTVPFVVPLSGTTEVKTSNRKKDQVTKAKAKSVDKLNDTKQLKNVDKPNDATKTETERQLDPAQLYVLNETKALNKLVKQNQLDDATQHVTKMIEANSYPLHRTFVFYLNKVAHAGNIDALEKLSTLLSDEMKRKVSINNRLGNAYLAAGKSELFLDQIINDFNNGNEEGLKKLENTFPKGAMHGVLASHPELVSKYETFAQNAAEKGFHAPINVLWMRHIENGELEEADRIMKSYLREEPSLMFNSTLKVARERNDEKIVLNLLKSLADSKVSEAALGVVHSSLIDVYCQQKKYDEALNAVNNSIKAVCLENISRDSLIRVKKGLEAAGKEFPHKIPDKKSVKAVDSSSSSSSSDDESTVKN